MKIMTLSEKVEGTISLYIDGVAMRKALREAQLPWGEYIKIRAAKEDDGEYFEAKKMLEKAEYMRLQVVANALDSMIFAKLEEVMDGKSPGRRTTKVYYHFDDKGNPKKKSQTVNFEESTIEELISIAQKVAEYQKLRATIDPSERDRINRDWIPVQNKVQDLIDERNARSFQLRELSESIENNEI